MRLPSSPGRLWGLSCLADHVRSWGWRPRNANPPRRLRKVPFLPAQEGKQQRAECGCSLRGSAQPPERVQESQLAACTAARCLFFFFSPQPTVHDSSPPLIHNPSGLWTLQFHQARRLTGASWCLALTISKGQREAGPSRSGFCLVFIKVRQQSETATFNTFEDSTSCRMCCHVNHVIK